MGTTHQTFSQTLLVHYCSFLWETMLLLQLFTFLSCFVVCIFGQSDYYEQQLAKCTTLKGEDCVFPFRYKNEQYFHCTYKDSTNGKAWCATLTDPFGNAVNNWNGDCIDTCLTEQNPCSASNLNLNCRKCFCPGGNNLTCYGCQL